MKILTIDIGGTAIKSAIYDEQGKLLHDLPAQKTAVSEHDNEILTQVLELIAHVDNIDGVAIASAGVVDPQKGEIIYAGPTIPHYTGTKIAAAVTEKYHLPCTVDNDVNAAVLGESWLGAAQGAHSVLCITIGTGVGGAVLLNGKLWHGHSFTAGEVGYLPLENGLNLQEAASTTALLAHYESITSEKITGEIFFQRVKNQEETANKVLNEFITILARGLLPAIYLLAPQVVVIGGGIAAQREILEPKMITALANNIQAPRFLPAKICCATLGNRAGMLGALYHFLQKNRTH